MKVWVWKYPNDDEVWVSPEEPTKGCGEKDCPDCKDEELTSGEAICLCNAYGLFSNVRKGRAPKKFELTAKEIV